MFWFDLDILFSLPCLFFFIGYYCPELYTCILPCAKGAYCVQFEAIMEKGKQVSEI